MEERVYHTRLTSLLFNTCSNVIRALLHFLVLNEKNQTYTTVNDFVKKMKKEITKYQVGNRNYHLLFPTGGFPTDTNSWDLQLLCFMICDIFQPNQKIKEYIEFLRKVRNKLCHVSSTNISVDYYERKLKKIKEINDSLLQTIGDGDLTKNTENQTEDIINDRLDIAEALSTLQNWLERDKSLQDESCTFTAAHIQALETVKNRATADTDINIPETKLVMKISKCIKEKEVEICRKIADAIFMTTHEDPQFQPGDGDTRMKEIITNTLLPFFGKDLAITGASLGCVIITVKPKSINSLVQLWTKCVNGEITKIFTTLQAYLREAYKNEVNIEVILPEIEFWEVINKIAVELKVELPEGTRLELPEHMRIAKASARSCLEGKLIQSIYVNGAEIEMVLRPQSEMQLEHMKSFSASGKLNESCRKMAKYIGQQLKQENLTILPTFSVLETKEQMRNRSNGNTDSKELPLQGGRKKHKRLEMERINYDRQHRIVSETGSRILRYLIRTESPKMTCPDLDTLLRRQNRKDNRTTDIDQMDFLALANVFIQIQKELNLNSEIVELVSFLREERNSLCHMPRNEVANGTFDKFLFVFESKLYKATENFENEFVKDLKDFIKEIKTSNINCKDVGTAIDVQEVKPYPKDERLRIIKEATEKIEADGEANAALLGQTALHRTGEKRISIRSYNDKRRNLESCLNKLGQTSDKAKGRTELWTRLSVPFANIQSEISLEHQNMKRVKILVIGEKDSGAYSFLNFMIGKNIFPASSAAKNAIILKKGVNKGLSSLTEFHQRKLEDTGDIFIELPYPCELLQDEIEWVVLPESWENIATVEGKLSDADGLLYIVNSGNTSGLDKEQLGKISALQRCPVAVILNKWDHADYSFYAEETEARPSNKEEIKRQIVSHLRRFFPGINEGRTQRFSVMQARGYTGRYDGMDVDQEYNAKQLLQELMENSVENRLNKTERWIYDRASEMKMCIKKVTAEESEAVKQLTEKENEINYMSERKKRLIETDVSQKTRRTAQNIADHVRSPSVKREMNDWRYADFPCSLLFDSKETIRLEVNRVVTRKLGYIITRDKKETFENYRKEMISFIQHETDEIKESLNESHEAAIHQIAGLNVSFNIREDAFTNASLWGSRLEDSLKVEILLQLFYSAAFIALGLIALPLALFISFFTDRLSSIHVQILRKASNRLIYEIDERKISEIFEKQLKDLRDCINEFFINSVPSCTRELCRVKSGINYSIQENQELERLITF